MKKRYKLKNFGYISSICPEAPIDGFGVAIGAADVITCTNFLVIGEGVWILWGVENCHLPLTKPVAVTQGWRYRAARDDSVAR